MCGKQFLVSIPLFGVIFFVITFTSSLQKSPTFDEAMHLFAGYSHVKWGDFRVNPEHPPLAKVLAALPLLALEIQDPRLTHPFWDEMPEKPGLGWFVANHMIFSDNHAETLFFYAKLPMIGLAMLLGAFVYLWARDLYGVRAAIASLFLFVLDPNILAHSPIVHTDIPFAAFFFIGTYFLWRALNRLTWSSLLLTLVCFGLAAITKYSFFAILPIWTILGLIRVFSSAPQESTITYPRQVTDRWGKATLLALLLAGALVAAYFSVWAAYGFRFDPLPERVNRHFPLASVMPENSWVRALTSFSLGEYLLPEAWIYGILFSFKFLRRFSYLLGEVSTDGFWLYFPIAFLVKTPLPTIFLLVGVVVLIFRRPWRAEEAFLIVPAVTYFLIAVCSRMNLGLRHILPLYPFLFVLVAGAAAQLWGSRVLLPRLMLVFLGLWYVWSSISIYPHYLAYFNEIAGGPKNGYRYLVDSNLDWGQDLKGLKRWMDRHGVKKIYLAYFGTADPVYYGIDAVHLPETWIPSPPSRSAAGEAPKYVAVGATHLTGVYVGEEARKFFEGMRLREPVAIIGYSIFVYELNESK